MLTPCTIKPVLVNLLLLFFVSCATAQQIHTLHTKPGISLRGLSVVTDQVIWVSGSKGTVGRSLDGGSTWEWTTVPEYESRDFRDIEAFNTNEAVIIAIAHPAHILRTSDGGKSWKLVYENNRKEMFLDAMDFSGDQHGIVVGDPVDGRLFVARTSDGGKTWLEGNERFTTADSTEGCFAASGTNIRLMDDGAYYFVTGGLKSRLISDSGTVALPFDNSKPSRGANSLAIDNANRHRMIVAGGDFALDSLRDRNCFISDNRGATWHAPKVPPNGYRSCVEFMASGDAIACGLNGVDISLDGGSTWTSISRDSYHACRKAKKGTAVFLTGNNGRIGKFVQRP